MACSISLPTLGLKIPEVTFVGPPVDDIVLAELVPIDIFAVLVDINGFVAFDGAFHFRGISSMPEWHSLALAWTSTTALHTLYSALLPSDVPFAQDALGNQFVLRGDQVSLLDGETGELEPLHMTVQDLFGSTLNSPGDILPTNIVKSFQDTGGALLPGELPSVYPPFCTKDSAAGVSVKAIAAQERIRFLAHFAAQIAQFDDGARIEIITNDDGGLTTR